MLLNKKISISYFLNSIKIDLFLVISYTLVTSLIRHYAFLEYFSLPLSLAIFIGTLISLLLAFKTGQSYERWWEARIIWGAVVNDSRSLIRQVKLFLPMEQPGAKEHLESFTERQIVWVYALGESLRKLPFSPMVSAYLKKHQIESSNIPNTLLERHTEELKQVSEKYHLNPNIIVQIDDSLVKLTDHMGKSERIKNTVFPRSYTVLIKFIIYVFITIFPFGLRDLGEAAELVLSLTVPLLFIAIEKTAIILQDPFENAPTDTPMTAIAQTIERNLNEVVGKETPDYVSQTKETYYIM